MNKRIKDLTIGFLVGCVVMMTTPVLADSIIQKIDVALNIVKVEVNGEKLDANNILYNGTTYLPMRAVAEAVGKDVDWNQDTMTASIVDENIKQEVNNVGEIEITYEDFMKMFDFRFSTDEPNNTKIRHFVYNGNLTYDELKELAHNYGKDNLLLFGSKKIEELFGEEDSYTTDRIILCFNYDYVESMFGGQDIFQIIKHKNSNEFECGLYE